MVIFEAKLSNSPNWKGQDTLVPVLAQIGENYFEIATGNKEVAGSWQIFDKLLYFYLNGIDRQTLLDRVCADGIYRHSGEKLFSTKLEGFDLQYARNDGKAVKVADALYMKTFDSSEKQLDVAQAVCASLEGVSVRIFVCEKASIEASTFKKELASLKAKLEKSASKKIRFKKGKLVCAHINGLILSDKEKLVRYVRKEFDKKILIGDIVLDENQEKIVKEITARNVESLMVLQSKWFPYYDLVFALGLVRFAMKHYNAKGNGEFWLPFAKVFGYRTFPPKMQEIVNNFFDRIASTHNKAYSNSASSKIDNVTMHCFVSDSSANDLFDYLFAFWRLDLQRNVENLDTPEGEEAFDDLISEMRKGNQAIRSHTALLLKINKPKSVQAVFKNRVKRILRLMHSAFWDGQKVPTTGNRVNALLEMWTALPEGAFAREKNFVRSKGTFAKGEILFHKPVLRYEAKDGAFSLVLPFQRLIDCDNADQPVWRVETKDGRYKNDIVPEFGHDKIGFYVEKEEVALPSDCLLSEFVLRLETSSKKLKSYVINASSIRFFDQKGRHIDHRNAIVPEGIISAFSDSEGYPEVLGMKSNARFEDPLWVREFNVEKGDVLVLNEGFGLQIGQALNEGFCRAQPLSDCVFVENEKSYSIYKELPKFLVKAEESSFKGASLVINGKQNNISAGPYEEFRLQDDVKTNGYLADLNDYIKDDGFYEIRVTLPNRTVQEPYYLAYCKEGVRACFQNPPYIFVDKATILYKKGYVLEEKSTGAKWSPKASSDSLCVFNFAQRSDIQEQYCLLVEDDSINLKYAFLGQYHRLNLKIPALYWSFDLKEGWKTGPLPDLCLKDLKGKYSKLYVKGPFDFDSAFLSAPGAATLADEESRIGCEKGKIRFFDLSKVYGWFCNLEGADYEDVYLCLEGRSRTLAKVACRSIVRDVDLLADYANGTIHGVVDILGDESYTVTVSHNGVTLCEDESIKNGKFTIDAVPEEGDYEVYIYEIQEETDGFDLGSDTVLLTKKALVCRIFDLRNLAGAAIGIVGCQDKQKTMGRIKFEDRYLIEDIRPVSYEALQRNPEFELELWEHEDCAADESSFLYYYGLFGKADRNGKIVNFKHDVLFAFSDPFDPNSIMLQTKTDEGGYESVFVDFTEERMTFHKEVAEETKMNPAAFYPTLMLYDENSFIVSLKK